MIYCLMVSGAPVSPSVRNRLYILATQMAKAGKQKESFRADDCEGVITTTYEESFLGTVYGTVFSARVETDPTPLQVTFLVNLDFATIDACDRENDGESSHDWVRHGPRPGHRPKELLN